MTQPLEAEIKKGRLEISAETISMSITELTNLYAERVLDIRPEFQRLFRWTQEQKSRLVESILLGIPIPSLFVSQSEDGKWELVDGLQRVSTILELQGLLRGSDGSTLPALTLSATKYLPSLEGATWSGDSGRELTAAQQLDIRLARVDIKVIKRASDAKAKFDLFQRLNSFGTTLEPQEIRSAMIAGTNGSCLAWLSTLATDPNFQQVTALSDRLTDEQYDLELILRFLMLHNRELVGKGGGLGDFSAKLDDWSLDFATEFDARHPELERVFTVTFAHLADHGGEDLFRKWDSTKGQFRGGFLNSTFEVVALGAGYHIANGNPVRTDPTAAARTLWELSTMNTRFATGLATGDRLAKTIPLGRKLMSEPPTPVDDQDLR